MHQEMPQGDSTGRMHGFQFWANLPSSLKMTTPRYQDVKSDAIPDEFDDDGTRVRVVCGRSLPHESENRSLILFDRGDEVVVQAGDQGIRFLLVSGPPIEEPVAWYGPIVMNTDAELQQAIADLRHGTFSTR
jgi:redox-sensitive bicupin YhaK (pirin superfamily)